MGEGYYYCSEDIGDKAFPKMKFPQLILPHANIQK